MPAIYEHHHRVIARDIDGQGHAGNVAYVGWMQDAAVAHSTAQGWTPERYKNTGAGWVVRHHDIEYLKPAWENDQLVIVTWIADFKKLTSLRRYRIVRRDPPGESGGESVETVLAVAATDWVYIGFQRRMPRRIPDELSASFEVVPDAPGDGSLTG
jgi:acyl-CoA thioester hydrolase